MTIFLLGFIADVFLQLLDPVLTLFPRACVSTYVRGIVGYKYGWCRKRKGDNLLGCIKHVPEDNTAAGHVDVNRERLGLGLGLQNLSLGGGV